MSNKSNNGTDLLGVLGVSFVVLKLIGIIDWSWWLVTLPFYGLTTAILLIGTASLLYKEIKRKKNGPQREQTESRPLKKESKFEKKLREKMNEAKEDNKTRTL